MPASHVVDFSNPNVDRTVASSLGNQQNAVKQVDLSSVRRVEYLIYVFTVSKKQHNITRPLFPRLVAPACEPGQRYRLVTKIEEPTYEIKQDPDNPWTTKTYLHKAEILANDICCTSNYQKDQYANIPMQDDLSLQSNDFGKYGIFWTKNEVPTEQELTRAEQNAANYYRTRLKKMDAIPDSDPSKAQLLIPDDHDACEFFDEERPWHKKFDVKSDCPNCGEKIKKGIAFHRSNGALCVIDWQRTVMAGAAKKDDVPEEMRWWKKPGPKAKEEVTE